MNNIVVLESLASDLKRVSLGYQRGSNTMALRFIEEAKKRITEVDSSTIPEYVSRILINIHNLFILPDKNKITEDSLVYSTLLQNYTQKQKLLS